VDNILLKQSTGLSVTGLSLKYPGSDKQVLDDINFSLNMGEVCFITGANSSGKSSLLAALAGLIPSSIPGELTGKILLNNKVADELSASLCIQDSDIYLFEEVYREIAYPLLNASFSSEETADKVRVISELSGVKELLGRKMSTLSGGERQKVAIAAALACDKELILLDEPYEQFDPCSVKNILGSLKRYAHDNKRVLIITSKRYEYADGIADRLFNIENGRLTEIRNPVYSYPHKMRADALPKKTAQTGDEDSSLISFTNVTHKFSENSGISGINICFNKGEITGIMGPNGAGKTTLLKHCIGLLRPHEGSVLYSGKDIKDIPVNKLAFKTGMLFQNPDDQIFNERADIEIAWGLTIRGMNKKRAVEKAVNILDEFGMNQIAGMHPHSLSRSVRQVIALASVLVTEPDILILDEPTRTMDDRLIDVTMKIIKRYLKIDGAVVIISHDPSVIWNYTERCYLINNGEIAASGYTESIFKEPDALKSCGLDSHPFITGLL